MPGALRARSLACQKEKHTSKVTAGSLDTSQHSPHEWFYGFLRALPGEPGLLSPSPARSSPHRLDISVGISGPHDFAVRDKRTRLVRCRV
ncbi:MAG: hypothetical protein WBF62_11590, partial [Bradyrhizobium sp.]